MSFSSFSTVAYYVCQHTSPNNLFSYFAKNSCCLNTLALSPVLGKVTFKSNALQYCVTP